VAQARTNRYWTIAIIFLIAVIIITVFIARNRYRPSQPIEILLPSEQEFSGNIAINGAVTNPGIYQFSGSDTIGALLLQIYHYALSPYRDQQQQAWAGAFLLILLVLGISILVRWLSNRKRL
jgi:heme/copper-type cytochrome/quinol oxidase subunit 2